MDHRGKWTLALLAVLGFATAVIQPLHAADDPRGTADDWPFWRGPEHNGTSRAKNLPASWSPEGENLVWKNPALGTRSTPVVFGNRLYTICRHEPDTVNEGEQVVCANADTGEVLWRYSYNVFLTDAPAERVGWSAVNVDPTTGYVYAMGLCSVFTCLNGETGEVVWQHSMSEEYGLLSTYGGRTHYPVLFDNVVMISGVMTGWDEYAVPAHRYVAFDKKTGQAIWITSTRVRPEDTTFSCPQLGYFNGQAAWVAGAGDGSVYALQPRTGKQIWQFDVSPRGINATPLIVGDTVYISHEEANVADTTKVGGVFSINALGTGNVTASKLNWNTPDLTCGRAQPLLVNDRLYMIENGGTMHVLNAKTGERIAKQKLGTIMFGSPCYADGKIYIAESTGRCYIFEPSEEGLKTLHKLRLDDEEIFGSMIVARGKVYLPTTSNIYCIGLADAKPTGEALPPAAAGEPQPKQDVTPALVQVAPVEMLLRTGQRQKLQVRLYNAAGRFLKLATEDVKFSIVGPGSVDEAGFYSFPAETGHATAFITAEVGELKGKARVRIVPPLPWSFDFNDKKVPPTWIGAAYRHQPRDLDGESVMAKITTIPKGTRSQLWMGQTNLHDYTVQMDFKAAIKDNKLPDVGLINDRYVLDLQGSYQAVQIRTWASSIYRFKTQVPFAWKEGVWYTMKFRSETADKKVLLKGKIFERGQPEPEAWTIEGEDVSPNLNGSPGMFGNASDAEIYIDNVLVTANSAATPAATTPAAAPAEEKPAATEPPTTEPAPAAEGNPAAPAATPGANDPAAKEPAPKEPAAAPSNL